MQFDAEIRTDRVASDAQLGSIEFIPEKENGVYWPALELYEHSG